MAASESKPDDSRSSYNRENDNLPSAARNHFERNRYWSLDLLFYLITIAIFATTIVTGIFVIIEHWINLYKLWAFYTLLFALVPSLCIQMLSLKWYQNNGDLKLHHWIFHIIQLAIAHRFYSLLSCILKSIKLNLQQKDWIFRIENDAFTLNLFSSILVSVPQIILQIYIMVMLQHITFWTSAAVISSLFSLTWGLTAYALLINRTNQDKTQFTWSSMMIHGFWKGGMLASRITAIVLAAICLKTWILVIFGIHTLGMTIWIGQQSTNFCFNVIEEVAYKSLIGAVYFFDFLRLSDNQIKYHICLFYSVIIIQNAIFYAIYLVSFKDHFQTNVFTISTVLIIGGTFVGAVSMIIHFCMFQNLKTIKLCKRIQTDPQLSLKSSPNKSIRGKSSSNRLNNEITSNEIRESIIPDITADKKSLLTNIVQNSDSLEKGIINTNFIKNDEANVTVQVIVEDNKVMNVDVSVENLQNQSSIDKKIEDTCSFDITIESLDSVCNSNNFFHRQRRRGICSEMDLDLKPNDSCNVDLEPQLCSQKRRGICSLTQLGLEIVTDEENYVEKSFSLDKLKSNSELSLNVQDKTIDSRILELLPIKSIVTSDNSNLVIPESILIRGRLNTPVIPDNGGPTIATKLSEKSEDPQSHQEEETMSHVTSIHDYENLCPLGVARPPWCIRSWKGYTDIETYIHDDSVVRDRRRDTLTSTATGTTLSSDFSDGTYTSLRKLMKRSRQDDYLDTLIYDLVDWESISNRIPVEEASTAMSELLEEPQVQDQTNLFSAKPIVIDEKGGMLALNTILEEREDSSFLDLRTNPKSSSNGTCSVSSLVATIDEIRRCTADNSPRHVYHRTESQWEDLETKILMKRTSHLTKVLFTNDYSNVTFNYADPWSESFVNDMSRDKLDILREVTNYCLKDAKGKTPLINAILSDSPILAPKTETQSCESESFVEEDNVYVDMNALGAQKCSTENYKKSENTLNDKVISMKSRTILGNSNESEISVKQQIEGNKCKKVAFDLKDEIINGEFDTCSEISDSLSSKSITDSKMVSLTVDNKLSVVNRPRRKFSLIRERFESKSKDQIVCVVSPDSTNTIISDRSQLNSLNTQISVIFDSSLNQDKENLTTKSSQTVFENKSSDVLKEKRSLFFKQVLSPPKFQGWGKKRTFSPNAKIIPKAH